MVRVGVRVRVRVRIRVKFRVRVRDRVRVLVLYREGYNSSILSFLYSHFDYIN